VYRLSKAFFSHLQISQPLPVTSKLDFHAEGKPLKAAASPTGRKKGKVARGGAKLKRSHSAKPGKANQAKGEATATEIVCHPTNPGRHPGIQDS